ncbi:heavy-metal-associated domain-containing protein [Candidatus Protofrankia californiensis]|uniref:heavy-metal-associated domain-containing protein n=1 Tax=Candidatus Protofrankia californiensis TaxID=1839754 RepID=UPI00104100F0|nr:heavy-metal-associated domain-containing protein [Candidatus Protofrankia californiensis]
MTALTVQVPDISCGHCKAAIEEVVGRVPGVTGVSVDVDSASVQIQRNADADIRAIEAAIVDAGYTVGAVVGV